MLVYSFEILEGEKVFINNGVVSYMFDSFKWIKTFNKLRTRRNKGLFYHGSTYIEKDERSSFCLDRIILWSKWRIYFTRVF